MNIPSNRRPHKLFLSIAALFLFAGCGMGGDLDRLINPAEQRRETGGPQELSDYYEGFYKEVTKRVGSRKGVSQVQALDALPKDPAGNVSWTAAVVNGYINPRASLDPGVEDDPPLNLNIFIEAKVPLMANVIFPHSIHTYWLSCNNCHPKIFLPEAGANPISMDEIFKGEWCGRCHNKVAFAFWPRENCVRCHIVLFSLSRPTQHHFPLPTLVAFNNRWCWKVVLGGCPAFSLKRK
ncbi:MAG: cytochrome c3 family protein [Deltaproteobacteria bacterium]|nr:cytochrome c3 family protein [Deltaproteobacteria bacterium]